MVTKEEIIKAYHEVLKRPPENEKVIQEKLSLTNYQVLTDLLYESREFKKNLNKKIILSYGLPKSASTYIYTITREIIINSKQRLIDVPSWVHGNYQVKHLNFIHNCTDDVIKKITDWIKIVHKFSSSIVPFEEDNDTCTMEAFSMKWIMQILD